MRSFSPAKNRNWKFKYIIYLLDFVKIIQNKLIKMNKWLYYLNFDKKIIKMCNCTGSQNFTHNGKNASSFNIFT